MKDSCSISDAGRVVVKADWATVSGFTGSTVDATNAVTIRDWGSVVCHRQGRFHPDDNRCHERRQRLRHLAADRTPEGCLPVPARDGLHLPGADTGLGNRLVLRLWGRGVECGRYAAPSPNAGTSFPAGFNIAVAHQVKVQFVGIPSRRGSMVRRS